MKAILLTALLTLFAGTSQAQIKADDVSGVWLTHGDKPAKVNIYRTTAGTYAGRIIWLQFPDRDGKPLTDYHNPDTLKQARAVLGLIILIGFRFDGDEWDKGNIYDPESGKTYSCTMTLKDANTLKVRGFVGISLLGRTEYWTRTTAP